MNSKISSVESGTLNLFSEVAHLREVVPNVASVPQRSPFRYPGGKTWLIPVIRTWLKTRAFEQSELFEIFAGGATVGLTAAFEGLVRKSILVEYDRDVSAVWHSILGDDWIYLANRIVNFKLTPANVRAELDKTPNSVGDHAFQTILRNRVNHGGILAPGVGLIKSGENGKGLSSRWYPDTLYKRISAIAYMRERIDFIEGDGLQVLSDNSDRSDVAFFIDPPYTAAGKKAGRRLYACNDLDHDALFALTSKAHGDFLMTYDNAEGVKHLAKKYGFDYMAVSMKNTHHANMTELLIGRNLDWARVRFEANSR
jgi:DNA adenine methylase